MAVFFLGGEKFSRKIDFLAMRIFNAGCLVYCFGFLMGEFATSGIKRFGWLLEGAGMRDLPCITAFGGVFWRPVDA